MDLTVLGKDVRAPQNKLESFPAPQLVSEVTFETDELTSLCPVTGQPDFSRLQITYQPAAKCLESKSLKLYLWQFRDKGIFGEMLAQMVAQAIFEAIAPKWIQVKIFQGVRGGIRLTATACLYPGMEEGYPDA